MEPTPLLATTTSTTLLEGLRDPSNRTLWGAYVERYRPTMLSTLRRSGVAAADAEDVAQAALLAFSEAYREGAYERERGRLRDWLFGILRNKLSDWRRRAGRQPVLPGATAILEAGGGDDELERAWEEEWQRSVLAACVEEVRGEFSPTTLAAFEAFALGDRPADEVASELDLTPNAVYGAKRRVLRRIRELLPRIEGIW